MSEEWGPWIEHDGKGCPCVGMRVEGEQANGLRKEWRATDEYNESGNCWDWGSITREFKGWAIIRYRIRRPRALRDLIEMVENLPAPSREGWTR